MKPQEARVLLTGATGGIGQAVARKLLAAGASVLLSGRSPGRLSALVRELDAQRGTRPSLHAHWHAADLCDAGMASALADTARRWGCNVVVHGAGAPAFGQLVATDPARLAQTLHTNLVAPMLLTQALLPHLCEQARAQVICIGSVLGRIGLPGYSVYSASKFGLRGFAEALRRELRNTSVRVQYLGPRSTRTAFNDAAVEHYNQRTGTAMDDVDTVAEALLRLLQDEAAERFLGFPEAWAVRLNGLAPALMDKAFDQHSLAAADPASGSPRADTPLGADR
jgi:short-subunit dehydrogenase